MARSAWRARWRPNSIPCRLRCSEQTEALTRELLTWLQATLKEGREAGVFHFGGDPAGKAALILSSLQGALQMARALGTDKFHAVVQQHKQDLLVARINFFIVKTY